MQENVAEASPASSIIPECGVSTQIIEEGPRICPLCSSEIRLFFIHFNEQMLMCENTECDYPFGYEELQFVKVRNDEEINDDISVRSRSTNLRPSSPANSLISTSGLSEIDKINQVYESEDIQLEPRVLRETTKKKKMGNRVMSKTESDKLIQKNIKDLKGLALELTEVNKKKKILKNEKWIKNLMHLQDQSGRQLLQPQEMKKLNKTGNKNELKIDIEPGGSSCVSSIKINIAK